MVIENPEIITPETNNYQAHRDIARVDFDDPQIDSFTKAAVLACSAAAVAPTSHGMQQYGLMILEMGKIRLMPDLCRPLPASDSTGRQMYESVGTVGANMKIALKAAGWLPVTQFITETKSGMVYQDIKITPGYQPTETDKMLAKAIPNRVNYDGNHLATPLPDELLPALEKLNTDYPDVEFKLVRKSKEKKDIGDLIRDSGRLIYKKLPFVGELIRCLRDATTGRKDGLLTSKLGGMNRFVQRYAPRVILDGSPLFVENVADQDRRKTRNSAGIGVLGSKEDNPVGWMRVGEFLEHAILMGVAHGVQSGIRAALIETDDLHLGLEKAVGLESRAQAMYRLGFPEDQKIYRGPRHPFEEKLVVEMGGELRVPSSDKPTIFKLGKNNYYRNVKELLKDLGHEYSNLEVDELSYEIHDLPDLFSVLHPEINFDPGSVSFLERLEQFVRERSGEDQGVWVYNPKKRSLKHFLNEEDFYKVKTANNSSEISEQGQKNLKNMRAAVAGLSGSGLQAMMAIVMSGGKYLRLADFDLISLRNKGRMTGKVGENKAYEAAWAAWEENPFLEIEIFEEGITDFNVEEFVKGQDVIAEQMDSSKKFGLREAWAKAGKPGSTLIMVTDFPDPIVEIERPGDKPFGGRAEAAGIDKQKMGGIISGAESTGYLQPLMGAEDIPGGFYDHLIRIINGQENAYSQLFISTQAGGAVTGQVVIAIAEGKIDQLPSHWVARLLPQTEDDIIKQASARAMFEGSYSQNIGEI